MTSSTRLTISQNTQSPHRANAIGIAETFLSEIRKLYERDGLEMVPRDDLNEWVDHMRTAPGVKFIMPTFNPRALIIRGPRLWIKVQDEDRRTVACMAARRLVTRDYNALLGSGVLWAGDGSRPHGFLLKPKGVSGVISHVGGLWVHPDRRGDGLSWIVPRTLGALCLQRWYPDYHAGIVQEGLKRKNVPQLNYGVGTADLCIDGVFAPTGKHERIFSAVTTRKEIIQRMHSDLDEIFRERHKQIRDFAPIARHRDH